MTIEAPWERHEPYPIPDLCTATALRLLPDESFDAVGRSNLLPGKDRAAFEEFWTLLAFNDDLAERCFDTLEEWLDRCEAQPDEGDESARVRKFRRICDDAWNRLTKIRDLDVAQRRVVPAPHTIAGTFAAAIATHRQALTESTDLDGALWAAVRHSRDRARRSPETTKAWLSAPVLTTQLIDAVAEHRRLNDTVRDADVTLYSVLQD